MKRPSEAIERDLAALMKRSHDLRREAEELQRTADEVSLKAARLREDLAKRKRLKQRGPR